VVGLVEHAASPVGPCAPRETEVEAHEQVGAVTADHPGDAPAQGQPVVDHAVGVAQELDGVDADDRRAGPLFELAHPSGLLGGHGVDARLAHRRQGVGDGPALAGPAGNRRGGAVLEVVGVGHHTQGPLPVVGKRLERR
jgi:hypothetical protein